ncbi:MAG: bifunctional adenosylcobinamide kinase/adenosylcobinamide-phosphate guanylyltransferase [Oscillospiraceae bacterium]|jgi:adenosyl cobinamide kinase/adenosyl cobinamide phosphate guanylyltransferase|nr:bifunctional adenosylcobinamide kinase/adenosylcobinamide-phosphate guanylyltransferase [Oscillospiraceae bacterium]
MILVVGGAGAGKREYVRNLGWDESSIADGVIDDRPVIINLQDAVFNYRPESPEAADALLESLANKAIVVCDEVGGGIIPLERRDREARDACGRLCCRMAQRAEKVVRVVCGLPIIIKGEYP